MKRIILSILGILFAFVLLTTFLISKKINDFANSKNLPIRTISLMDYHYSSLSQYTNIDLMYWGFETPIYKVKEYNPYNDYWVVDDEQSIVVDLEAYWGDGEIKVKDILKIPSNFHSDKISKVSLSTSFKEKIVYLDLTLEEVLELEKMVFSSDDEFPTAYEDNSNETTGETWFVRFHIKDIESLYYYDYGLVKSTNGNYYTGSGIVIPDSIASKIDEAFQNANVEF